MSKVKFHKYVAQLPVKLEPDSIYYVRSGAGVDIYVTNSSGVIAPMPTNQNIEYYSKDGRVGTLKCWIGEARTDESGEFIVDWSSAGFSQAPLHVTVTSFMTAEDHEKYFGFSGSFMSLGFDKGTLYRYGDKLTNITVGAMNDGYNKTGGAGYVIGGVFNAKVTIMAHGI